MGKLAKASGRFTEKAAGDEIIIMHLDTGEFLSLTGTAASAWRMIDGTRDREGLISALATTYRADERHVASDVDEYLIALQRSGLLADE
jgi:pyrroloquinoline quinone biosynthesis protein D